MSASCCRAACPYPIYSCEALSASYLAAPVAELLVWRFDGRVTTRRRLQEPTAPIDRTAGFRLCSDIKARSTDFSFGFANRMMLEEDWFGHGVAAG